MRLSWSSHTGSTNQTRPDTELHVRPLKGQFTLRDAMPKTALDCNDCSVKISVLPSRKRCWSLSGLCAKSQGVLVGLFH